MTIRNGHPGTLAETVLTALSEQSEFLQTTATRRGTRAFETFSAETNRNLRAIIEIATDLQSLNTTMSTGRAFADYVKDAMQRGVLFADALRQWSDTIIAHNQNGAPPVLIYESELVKDGRDLPRPCNYFLLKITPPDGIVIDETKRPYVIIDPRAGHGGGIGGFKKDSQVGVALKAGHPVYFVAFRQMPEPGQTLAHVTDAEAAFLRIIEEAHPDAPKPVVIGNCQGGWATAILAAANPDLTGPIILNGAPMSHWGGKVGQDLMRYSGGLTGGVLPAMVAGDMAGGIFDGAYLVDNFEKLNPGRNYFGKFFDLYRTVDTGVPRFLGFERWWGGFMLMTTEEITWIIDELFVGNKLAKNQAQIEPGRPIDLKKIRAPIICFASHGDNITPPAQALNWIMDTYTSELEIEVQGQRILYMLHDEVGHLGIFVSGKIANREHSQMAETLANIEVLAPGLFELVIEDVQGHGQEKSFRFSIARRKFADIEAATGGRRDEADFAAVARISEGLETAYDSTVRPFIRAAASPDMGDAQRRMHPMRLGREMFQSGMPGMKQVENLAAQTRDVRTPADPDNPFLKAEALWGEMIQQGFDVMRDMREAMIEMTFFGIYGSPAMRLFGASRNQERSKKNKNRLGDLPEVQMMLARVGEGGLAEGIVRALILAAATRPDLRSDRLERSIKVMHSHEPMASMSVDQRIELIHGQTVIAHFAPEAALAALPKLVTTQKDREVMMELVRYVVGPEDDMTDATRSYFKTLETLLDLPENPDGAPAAAAE
ncbi:MAG: DUF3141 domain-containing protein [Pseudomonadota bacterium]